MNFLEVSGVTYVILLTTSVDPPWVPSIGALFVVHLVGLAQRTAPIRANFASLSVERSESSRVGQRGTRCKRQEGRVEAGNLGFEPGTVIQELGWDEDVDDSLREAIEAHTGNELADGDVGLVVDGVMLWWRDGDGDLTDDLMDALQDLAEGGFIWLLTPKVGLDGYVSGADIGEAAPVAGVSITTTTVAGNWVVTKLSTQRR